MLKTLRKSSTSLALSTVLFALVGCGDDSVKALRDAGGAPSADAGRDAGATARDAGRDAGASNKLDAGIDSSDAGNQDDGGALDAAVAQTLSGVAVVYSASPSIGIDMRPSCDVTFDASGGMTYYKAGAMEYLDVGTCKFRSADSKDFVVWGTWIGGTTRGMYYAGFPTGAITFNSTDEGFHYAAGVPTPKAKLPTGSVTYTWIGNTAPTETGASAAGTLDSASLTIDFAAGTADVTVKATMPDGTVTESGSGTTFNDNGFSANSNLKLGVRGYVLGKNAEGAAISYTVDNGANKVIGTAVFQR